MDEPLVRVVRGAPTAEELAALVAALSVRATRAPAVPVSAWTRAARPGAVSGGLPVDRGPHAWRASGLP